VPQFVNHEANQVDILKWAYASKYLTKEAGRNAVRLYQPPDRSRRIRRLELAALPALQAERVGIEVGTGVQTILANTCC
jgi:hypothetical protein